jgi:hypothetical protein
MTDEMMALRERLKAKPELAKPATKPPDPEALPKALKVVARAKEVSHPDTCCVGIAAWPEFWPAWVRHHTELERSKRVLLRYLAFTSWRVRH